MPIIRLKDVKFLAARVHFCEGKWIAHVQVDVGRGFGNGDSCDAALLDAVDDAITANMILDPEQVRELSYRI